MSAKDREAAEVERLYSSMPIRVRVGTREYVLPRNFLTHKGALEPDLLQYDFLAFALFLPDYSGFTKSNWQQGWFDDQRIDVLELRSVDKTAVVPIAGGGSRVVQPANYGEPRARFENRKASLEAHPSLKMFGLEGYRRRNYPSVRAITWTGTRSNGEFFFFESTTAPADKLPPGVQFPLCEVRYYSEKEDQFLAYRYRQSHIKRWREIDTVIWRKVKEWLVT